jgi:hypothetical protein
MNNDGAVLAALPLALLQSTRAHDRPVEVLEDEDLTVSLPRRLGLSGVIESQIRQYEAAAKGGKRVSAEEFNNLLKLVLRRPDAEAILRETGTRVAQRQFERASPTVLKLLRILPRAATYAAIRNAATRLLRNISGNPGITVSGKPMLARMNNPQTAMMEPAGVACSLYAAAFEEIASCYLGRKANVAQVHCATNGGDYCEWRLES